MRFGIWKRRSIAGTKTDRAVKDAMDSSNHHVAIQAITTAPTRDGPFAENKVDPITVTTETKTQKSRPVENALISIKTRCSSMVVNQVRKSETTKATLMRMEATKNQIPG